MTPCIKKTSNLVFVIQALIVLFSFTHLLAQNGLVINHNCTNLSTIPDSWISQVKSDLHVAYNHTSHGSQLISGMNALENYPDFGNKYSWIDNSQGNDQSLSLDDKGIPGIADLSQGDQDSDSDGIANWAEDTYAFLNNPDNYHINVIMWSWCNIGGHNIDRYLNSMEWLIAQFDVEGTHPRATDHPVKFVFMTGHANGGGEGDSSDSRNVQIRNHVASHHRILFDFSDIENYDPDGNYYLDKHLDDALYYDSDNNGSRNANWASEYLINHNDSELDRLTTGNNVAGYSGCGSCAHSPEGGETNDAKLNCILKGRAVWYLLASIAGWDGSTLAIGENNLPKTTILEQNIPNPFSESTIINYNLLTEENVKMIVYDILGKKISTLVDEHQNSGLHQVIFKADSLPDGVYFYKLIIGNRKLTKKLILSR